MDNTRKIQIAEDAGEVCAKCAERLIELADSAIQQRGRFELALAGGSTPRRLYRLLARPEYASRLDRENTHVWFGDERCVPPDHADSNYRMARESMLDSLALPERNVHRYRCEAPETAAQKYTEDLMEISNAGERPIFDLILLGLGPDGHTASLFPGTAALAERERNIVTLPATETRTQRISFTYPLINAARNVFFLVTGESKADILRRILGPSDASEFPASGIRPAGDLVWWLDRAATSQLASA